MLSFSLIRLTFISLVDIVLAKEGWGVCLVGSEEY